MSGDIASFLRLLSNHARGYLVKEGVPSCATHAIHWFDDFCRKTRRFGVRVPRCAPVNAGREGERDKNGTKTGDTARGPGAGETQGAATGGGGTHGTHPPTQGRETGAAGEEQRRRTYGEGLRQAPTFAHVAAWGPAHGATESSSGPSRPDGRGGGRNRRTRSDAWRCPTGTGRVQTRLGPRDPRSSRAGAEGAAAVACTRPPKRSSS